MSGGPTTPIEQVAELGEQILEKLIAAGITTVEALADHDLPEQLEEVPGIGEKTVEKISVAVRHYFGHFDPDEAQPASDDESKPAIEAERRNSEEDAVTNSGAKTPEEILAAQAAEAGGVEEVDELSAEDLAALEESRADADGFSDNDDRESGIEMDNDTVDTLVAESEEVSDEGIDTDDHDRG